MRKDTPDYVANLAREMRNNSTMAEMLLWKHIRKKQIGIRFQRQYPIGRYIADFYTSKGRLVVEIDGGIHTNSDQMDYDTLREQELASRHIKVLRFSNIEVINNIDFVLLKITEFLNI